MTLSHHCAARLAAWLPLCLVAVACSSASETQSYRVSITNNNDFTVPAVDLSGDTTATFEQILARTTTAVRELSFADASVQVSCQANGCLQGRINLLDGQDSTIIITEGLTPFIGQPYLNPPQVSAVSPDDGTTDVGLNTQVQVTFSHAMRAATVTANTTSTACTGSLQLSSDDFASCVTMAAPPATTDDITFVMSPAALLPPATTFRIKVTGAAEDTIGAYMPVDFVPQGFETGAAADATPPADVGDLAVGAITSSSIELNWTAVGDDGNTGTAASYDVRYQVGPCPMSYDTATVAAGAPTPAANGTPQSFVVSPLNSNTQYCFALTVADEVLNRSAVSNQVSATVLQNTDVTAPATPSLSFDTVGSQSLRVTWTAVGDDGNTGTAASYALRYGSPNCPNHDADNFTSGTTVTGLSSPKPAGQFESVWVYGLSPSTGYCFVLRVADEVPNAAFSASAPVTTTSGAQFW